MFREELIRLFLKEDVVDELESQSDFFGLLYLIGLMQKLKVTSDKSMDNFFKGAFYKRKTPFLIGVTGAVSVGKSTFSEKIADNLHQMSPNMRCEVVSVDDFLYPNKYLEDHDLMNKKGFPESFDNQALWDFLVNAASFNESQDIPVYDHQTYDIVPNKKRRVRSADFVIVEGINILQVNPINERPFSEMMDLSIYLEAEHDNIIDWFLNRFNQFLDTADPESFYEEYAKMDREKANSIAKETYANINQPNFEQFIEPTRERAKLIVEFKEDHSIDRILMRDY